MLHLTLIHDVDEARVLGVTDRDRETTELTEPLEKLLLGARPQMRRASKEKRCHVKGVGFSKDDRKSRIIINEEEATAKNSCGFKWKRDHFDPSPETQSCHTI